jgi:hypothetical protein
MKRFLILFVLIAFVTVSYAGPNKVGWTKPDFRQDQFENDRKECNDSNDKNLVSDFFGKALEECLAQKGYKYQQVELKPEGNKSTTVKTGLLSAVIITGITAGIALLILAAAVGGAGSALGGLGH